MINGDNRMEVKLICLQHEISILNHSNCDVAYIFGNYIDIQAVYID